MKTMTIYALMGKIYNNNQDMPKKIKYNNKIYEWKEYDCGYQEKKKINWVKKWGYVAEIDRTYYYLEHCFKDLHDEVEIIEEKPRTLNDIRESYGLPRIEKNNKIEKLEIEQDTPSSNFYIRNENGTKCGLTKHSKMIADKLNELVDVINEMKILTEKKNTH